LVRVFLPETKKFRSGPLPEDRTVVELRDRFDPVIAGLAFFLGEKNQAKRNFIFRDL
jgi:hypothetical protein